MRARQACRQCRSQDITTGGGYILTYAGIAVFGGVSRIHPKMMKPKPIKKPSKVMTFRRKVKRAVIPVAFIDFKTFRVEQCCA